MIVRDLDLTPADTQVMQDYLDQLAEDCETERFLIWNHPDNVDIFGDNYPECVKP